MQHQVQYKVNILYHYIQIKSSFVSLYINEPDMGKPWYLMVTCVMGHEQYSGHIVIHKISQWWSVRRDTWSHPDNKHGSDQMVLSQHYLMFYGIINKTPIYEAYTVTFVQQFGFNTLDTSDDKWLSNLTLKFLFKLWFCFLWNNSWTALHCSLVYYHSPLPACLTCFTTRVELIIMLIHPFTRFSI